MSKYREIKTQFKNGFSLKEALDEMGVRYECIDPKENVVDLATHWRSFGGTSQKVAIAIQREEANRIGLGGFDGLGFRWNGVGYDLVQDHLDESNAAVMAKFAQLTQKYAGREVRRQAKVRGYAVQEVGQTDGSIRLVLTRR